MEYRSQTPPPICSSRPVSRREENIWALAAHLSGLLMYTAIPFGNLLATVAIWLMNRDTMPFVDDQAKESLNFQLTIMLYIFACVPLAFVLIGFALLPVVIVFHVVASIIAALKAHQGIAYRYPLNIRFI